MLDSALSWPSSFDFDAYVEALTRTRFFLYFFNSLLTSSLATILAVAIFGMAAYVLARYAFPGRDLVYAVLISSLLISLVPMVLFSVEIMTMSPIRSAGSSKRAQASSRPSTTSMRSPSLVKLTLPSRSVR